MVLSELSKRRDLGFIGVILVVARGCLELAWLLALCTPNRLGGIRGSYAINE